MTARLCCPICGSIKIVTIGKVAKDGADSLCLECRASWSSKER